MRPCHHHPTQARLAIDNVGCWLVGPRKGHRSPLLTAFSQIAKLVRGHHPRHRTAATVTQNDLARDDLTDLGGECSIKPRIIQLIRIRSERAFSKIAFDQRPERLPFYRTSKTSQFRATKSIALGVRAWGDMITMTDTETWKERRAQLTRYRVLKRETTEPLAALLLHDIVLELEADLKEPEPDGVEKTA